MTSSSRRLLVAGAAVAALAAAGLGTYLITDGRAKESRKAVKGPPPVPVTVAAVTLETVPIRLQAIGNVEAYSTVAIKARVDGQINTVSVRDGDPVKKGDLLFRIDPRPYAAALRQAGAHALAEPAGAGTGARRGG